MEAVWPFDVYILDILLGGGLIAEYAWRKISFPSAQQTAGAMANHHATAPVDEKRREKMRKDI